MAFVVFLSAACSKQKTCFASFVFSPTNPHIYNIWLIEMKMIHYYKYLISALTISVLIYFSEVHAAILDGGEVQFNGLVTDDAPKWTWQISSSEQSWTVDMANAHLENGVAVFDLRDKGIYPFLEGYLLEVADRGGPGFTPTITFSSSGQQLSIKEGGSTTAQHFRASVPVSDPDSGNVVGEFLFTFDQGMAVSFGMQEELSMPSGMSLISGQSVTDVQPKNLPKRLNARLSSLLLMNKGSHVSVVNSGQVISQAVLANSRVMNLAAAYASELSDFELRLPVDKIPSQWHARINVTVIVQ